MYFLRRRHGRKSLPEARRETPQAEAPARYEAPEPELEEIAPARPTVITKTRRQRSASPADEDCKPAGTFRVGTLHIGHPGDSQERHG